MFTKKKVKELGENVKVEVRWIRQELFGLNINKILYRHVWNFQRINKSVKYFLKMETNSYNNISKYRVNDPEKLKQKHLNTVFKFIVFDNSPIIEDLGTELHHVVFGMFTL